MAAGPAVVDPIAVARLSFPIGRFPETVAVPSVVRRRGWSGDDPRSAARSRLVQSFPSSVGVGRNGFVDALERHASERITPVPSRDLPVSGSLSGFRSLVHRIAARRFGGGEASLGREFVPMR